MTTAINSSPPEPEQVKLLAEYEQAREIAQHSDTVFHEVAAIAWGANTLLLGFILEVKCNSSNQILVIVAAVVGLFMSMYVPIVLYLTKIGQRIAYQSCREIENELHLTHRINNQIFEMYPPGRGQLTTSVITAIFVFAWLAVIVNSSHCLLLSHSEKEKKAVVRSAEMTTASMPSSVRPSSLSALNTGIQVLLLAGLIWYTLETRKIRLTSQGQFSLSREQVEATLRPCVTLSTTPREYEDTILALNGTNSAVVVRCPDGLVEIQNIGVGPATNSRYEFRPTNVDVAVKYPAGYVAGISVSGSMVIPVARALIAGHEFSCLFDYESVSGQQYQTVVNIRNLVVTNLVIGRAVEPPKN